MTDNLPVRLDRDLARLSRRAGKPTIGGALAAAFVSSGTVTIDLLYGGHPTLLAWVAVGVLVFFICPTLVIEALRQRWAAADWAREQQRQRDGIPAPRRKAVRHLDEDE